MVRSTRREGTRILVTKRKSYDVVDEIATLENIHSATGDFLGTASGYAAQASSHVGNDW